MFCKEICFTMMTNIQHYIMNIRNTCMVLIHIITVLYMRFCSLCTISFRLTVKQDKMWFLRLDMFCMIILIWHLACLNDPVCSSLLLFNVWLLLSARTKHSFILCKTTFEQNSSHVIIWKTGLKVFLMFLIIQAEGFLDWGGIYFG